MLTQYDAIIKTDILEKMKPLLDNGMFFLRDDGKLSRQSRLAHQTPWIHHKQARNRNCGLYHVYYERFGFIHSTCQECWKVVVRPRTLGELHQLMELQKAMDLPSKCGIEQRLTVCGLYGGYFYNDSLAKGLDCYKLVRANVDNLLGSDVNVLLKRSCTEFEIDGRFGPSDTWEISQEQKEIEYILDDLIDQSLTKMPQPVHLKENIFRSWIHWAYANGDVTYLNYTDGKPLFRQYKTYHERGPNEERQGSEKTEEHSTGSSGWRGDSGFPVCFTENCEKK